MTQYNHKEAFCLMQYAAEDSALNGEWPLSALNFYVVWNSRDGVTPLNYPICGTMCVHVMFHRDICKPDYQMKVGDLYFRDKTEEEARAEALRRMASFQGTQFEIKELDERYPGTIAQVIAEVLQIPVLDIFK